MEISILLARQIIAMFLIVIVGFCTVHFDLFTERDTGFLAKLNIDIICPCAIVSSFQMEFSVEKLTGLLLAVLAAVILHVLYLLLDFLTRRPLKLTPVESASVIYTNSLNLILPLVIATLSEDMVFYCTAFMVVQTFLMWTHGKSLVSGKTHVDAKDFLNPNIFAILTGLLLFILRIRIPEIPATAIRNIGSTVGPVSMLVIGMMIGKLDVKSAFLNGRAYFITFLRLIVYPLLTVLVLVYSRLGRLHPDGPDILLVTLLAASSCTASSIPQMARVYSDEGPYAGMLSIVNLAFCIVTMPVIVYIYQLLR